jgi:transcriptional regulator with XRE-family HTH domain
MPDVLRPNRLRSFRDQHGLRQADVAWIFKERTGLEISEATLSRLERGYNDSSIMTLATIARALDEDRWSSGRPNPKSRLRHPGAGDGPKKRGPG